MSPLAVSDSHALVLKLARQQYFRCHFCGRLCEVIRHRDWQWGYSMTIEHVIPRSRGGHEKGDNVVGSCYRCNHTRNQIEGALQGYGTWPDIPRELFISLLPVDIFFWSVNAKALTDVIQSLL
jgi:hypothetical protein